MANKLYQESDVQNIANAIRTKNGSSDTYKISQMANAILAIPSGGSLQSKSVTITQNGTTTVTPDTGYDGMDEVEVITNVSGGEVEEKDVNFYDYDGTLLYSYTTSEFANLTEFPENPSHTGLTSQGWNWSLAGAKNYVSTYEKLDIGQTYVTDDGKTRLYVEIQEYKKHVYVGFGINGTATIDWGDNSTSTLTGTSATTVKYAEHTYSQSGDYVVTIASTANIRIMGSSAAGSYLFTEKYSALDQNKAVLNSVKKIELGSNVNRLNVYAFYYMMSLETITIPTNVTSIDTYVLYFCCSLKFCVIQEGVSGIPVAFFKDCNLLKGVSLSEGCSTLGNNVFNDCYSLKRVTTPTGSTVLGSSIFANCYSLEEIILPENITTIGSTAFSMCNVLQIKLPTSLSSIGSSAFANNYKTKKYTIPSGVTTISNSCFARNEATVSFIFLGSITSIAAYAFQRCASVELFDFTHCTSVPTLANANSFIQSVNASIVVPDNLYDTWIAASNWSTYARKIVKESEWNA